MSDSWGAVKLNDGLIKYYLYHGSSDTCYTSLYDKVSEVAGDYTECNCGKSESVEIYSDYGGGFYWKGRACRDCGWSSTRRPRPRGWDRSRRR